MRKNIIFIFKKRFAWETISPDEPRIQASLSQIRSQGSPQLSPRESLVGGDPENEFEFYNGDVAKVQTCIKQTPTGPTLKKKTWHEKFRMYSYILTLVRVFP